MDNKLMFVFLTVCILFFTFGKCPFTYVSGSTISFYPKFSSGRLNDVVNLTCSFKTETPIVMTRNDTGSLFLICGNSSCINIATNLTTITCWSFIASNTIIVCINITDKGYYNSIWGCHEGGNLKNSDFVRIKDPVDLKTVTVHARDTKNTSEGSLLVIRCDSGDALPPAELSWSMENSSTSFKLPVSIFNISRDESTRNNKTGSIVTTSYLQLTPTRQDNGAKVWCTGQNLDNVIQSKNVTLNVWYTANVSTFEVNGSSQKIEIKEGASLEFRCEVDSNPEPTIQITGISDDTRLNVTSQGTQLVHILHNTSRLTDAGSYACSTFNGLYPIKDMRIVQVIVQYGPNIAPFLINNKSYESNVTLNETESIRMLCSVDGLPVSDVYIESNNTSCKQTQSIYSVLCEISSASCEKHAGLYTCHAQNPIGADSKSLTVFINCIPMLTINSKNHATLDVNESVTFSATITAYPAPDVFWILPNSSIAFAACHKETETIYLSCQVCNLTVKITNSNEYGTYKLTSYNMQGGKSIDFVIMEPIRQSSLDDKQPAPVNVGLIVGAVAGGLVVIAIIAVAVYFLRKRPQSDKGSSTERAQEGVYEESQMQDDAAESHQYASLSSSTEPVPRQPQSQPEVLTYINLELKQ